MTDRKERLWTRQRDALLVQIFGSTVGTVLAAPVIFLASSLGGVLRCVRLRGGADSRL
jgi:hypothetical protein